MDNDEEKYEDKRACHMLIALMRKKENDIPKKKVYRRIVYDYPKDLQVMRTLCKEEGGIWRIYSTVNKRDMIKALNRFRHTMIDTDKTSIESMWRKELLQPECRGERMKKLDKRALNNLSNWCKEQINTTYLSQDGYYLPFAGFPIFSAFYIWLRVRLNKKRGKKFMKYWQKADILLERKEE